MAKTLKKMALHQTNLGILRKVKNIIGVTNYFVT